MSGGSSPEEMKSAIVAAARKLPLLPDPYSGKFGDPIEAFANVIAGMAHDPTFPGPSGPGPWRPHVGRKMVMRELRQLRVRVTLLSKSIADMSAPTYQALWDAENCKTIYGLEVRAKVNELLRRLSFDLDILGQVVRTAPLDVPNDFEARGRNPDLAVAGIVKVTAWYFEHLTGQKPNQSYQPGGFAALLKAVFDALGIEASVERAAKDMIAAAIP